MRSQFHFQSDKSEANSENGYSNATDNCNSAIDCSEEPGEKETDDEHNKFHTRKLTRDGQHVIEERILYETRTSLRIAVSAVFSRSARGSGDAHIRPIGPAA
jgi:hypothetical protein